MLARRMRLTALGPGFASASILAAALIGAAPVARADCEPWPECQGGTAYRIREIEKLIRKLEMKPCPETPSECAVARDRQLDKLQKELRALQAGKTG